jgi:hypothetical protein
MMAIWAKKGAKTYAESLALNGVPIQYPTVNPTTLTWRFFDPTIPGYVDTSYTAIGTTPHIDPTSKNWFIGTTDTGINAQGIEGETPMFRVDNKIFQYRFPTKTPTVWTDLYEIPIALTYVHTQSTPSNTWYIQHNLGGQPITIFAVDDTGEEIVGQIDTSLSTLNLSVYRFSQPLTGKAYVKL